jgi:hypothetical protein
MKIRKVVCINVNPDGLTPPPLHLTYGKVYDHIDYDEGISAFIGVIDDSGIEFGHRKDRFISLDKWREKQLNELGI